MKKQTMKELPKVQSALIDILGSSPSYCHLLAPAFARLHMENDG